MCFSSAGSSITTNYLNNLEDPSVSFWIVGPSRWALLLFVDATSLDFFELTDLPNYISRLTKALCTNSLTVLETFIVISIVGPSTYSCILVYTSKWFKLCSIPCITRLHNNSDVIALLCEQPLVVDNLALTLSIYTFRSKVSEHLTCKHYQFCELYLRFVPTF